MPTLNEKKMFLQEDLYDALMFLFVGAVAWQATEAKEKKTEGCYQQRAQGMFTALVQARSLYEFYFQKKALPDDARASHFARSWAEPKSQLYQDYMCAGRPANKRVFHLVYGRGKADSAGDPIRDQVVNFAKDVQRITGKFAQSAETDFRGLIQAALDRALGEARKAAQRYGIAIPF